MPYTEKQRRFFYSELKRRKGGKKRMMNGIGTGKLEKLTKSPLEKEVSR